VDYDITILTSSSPPV